MKKINKTMLTILLVIAVLAIKLSSAAMPSPHGIDGYVLDLQRNELRYVSFSINNTFTGQYIEGTTGYGSPGRYSASLNGDDGDYIIVKAWNQYHNSTINILLDGVMHEVNIYLNTTPVESYPEEIITESSDGGHTQQIRILLEENTSLYSKDSIKNPVDENIYKNLTKGVNAKISKIDVPYKISGTIYGSFGMQVKKETKIIIENLKTEEIIETKTGAGPNPGYFLVLVYGSENDPLRLKVKENIYHIDLKDTHLELKLDKNRLSSITGLSVFGVKTKESYSIFGLLFLLIVMIIYRIIYIYKR